MVVVVVGLVIIAAALGRQSVEIELLATYGLFTTGVALLLGALISVLQPRFRRSGHKPAPPAAAPALRQDPPMPSDG
jgi:tellurite resistance protein TehA-like permease